MRIRGAVIIALLFCAYAAVVLGDQPCRDDHGRFMPCSEVSNPEVLPVRDVPEPVPVPPDTKDESSIVLRIAGGALTALGTDSKASIQPLATLGITAPLSTSERGPSLEVQADLTALPGETVSFADVESFKALEFTVGLSQPIAQALKFRLYADGGFASRLATTDEPVTRLPGFWSLGLLFRSEDHQLKVGLGGDQRLSGSWVAAVHVSGSAKIGERGGVSMYFVGSLIRALDLTAYGYKAPSRDSLRVGCAIGWNGGNE